MSIYDLVGQDEDELFVEDGEASIRIDPTDPSPKCRLDSVKSIYLNNPSTIPPARGGCFGPRRADLAFPGWAAIFNFFFVVLASKYPVSVTRRSVTAGHGLGK